MYKGKNLLILLGVGALAYYLFMMNKKNGVISLFLFFSEKSKKQGVPCDCFPFSITEVA